MKKSFIAFFILCILCDIICTTHILYGQISSGSVTNLNGNIRKIETELSTYSDCNLNDNNLDVNKSDPNTLSQEVLMVIDYIQQSCKIQDTIFPFSKKYITNILKCNGYDIEIINRAMDAVDFDWQSHALILSKYYYNKKIQNERDKRVSKGFRIYYR